MEKFLHEGKYNLSESFESIHDDLIKEIPNLEFYLDESNEDDANILAELFIYKNHPKLKSITEIYIENNKFRNEEKMLNCMNNSYVGLFKIIDSDSKNGYVTYEDVFTKKRFKIIDISLSSTFNKKNKQTIYMYNRIITE